MRKIYFFLALLLSFSAAQSQLLRWNTFGNTGLETTEPSVFNHPNVSSSTLTQGAGIVAAANTNRFGGSNWFDIGNSNPSTLAQAIAGNNYIQFVVTPVPGTTFTPTSLDFSWGASGTGPTALAMRSSADGFTSDIGVVTGIANGLFSYTMSISGISNVSSATTFRLYGYRANAPTGTGGFDNTTNVVDVQLNGYTTGGFQGDFYNSVGDGNWNNPASWESSPDGITWSPALAAPSALNASTITIGNGHTITLPVNGISFDQLVIEPGSQLTVPTGINFILEDGPGTDLDCQGTFLNAGSGYTITGTINLPANGTYIHNTTTSPLSILNKATINSFSTWIYRGSSSLAVPAEVNSLTYGHLRFESSSGSFIVNPVLLSGNNARVNDLYIGPGVVFGYSGFQPGTSWNIGGSMYVDGTINSIGGDLDAFFTGSGVIGGSFSPIPFVAMTFTGTANYTLGTDAQLTGGGNFTLSGNAVLDAVGFEITGIGGVNIQGKLITAHTIGLAGTFFNIFGPITLGVNSTVEYNSPALQYFTSPGLVTYGNVIISGGGTKLLAGNANIASQLFLVNGLFQLDDDNLLLSSTTLPTIPVYSTTSYIVTNGLGTLQQNIQNAGMYVFPVGTAAALEEATINFASPVAFNQLSARFISGSGGNNGLPLAESGDNITQTSVTGFWRISSASPMADAYTGTFRARSFTDIIDYSKLHLLKRSDDVSPWALNGTHVSTIGSNSFATLQRTGMSGFSDFGVGGQPNISLPVTIISFSGYKDGSRNQLKWTTASESDNRGFEIQRSADGINYSVIGFVNSLAPGGNSSAQLNYTFTDNNPASDKQYYRLRQEDLNGRQKFSSIVLIRDSKPGVVKLDGLFPNPATTNVNVIVAAAKKENITLHVTDLVGRNIMQLAVTVETGSNTVPLDLTGINSGVYIIRLASAENAEVGTMKFVKQ